MSSQGLAAAQERMHDAGVPGPAIDVFTRFYHLLEDGETGLIREADVSPLTSADVDHRDDLHIPADAARDALGRTVIIKLNGGLATSMGMDRAKSLLPVRDAHEEGADALTFLDITVRQVLAARARTGARLPLLLMNSFRTRADTLAALAAYPDLPVGDLPLDFLQNREPKLTADTLEPATWLAEPDLEWCPPGHGDLYTALYATGSLDRLLAEGYRYAAISNADNLGAAPEETMAGWFASTGAPYAAEVVAKTPADRKGGTLVRRAGDGRLALRDTAQIHPDDLAASEDIEVHPYFHTNNLWFDLEALSAELHRTGGVLHLPLIRNTKTVDPTDPTSPKVVQIESAMGAAVSLFDAARAIEVERARFLPVKTTNDLMLVRSDVYRLDGDYRLSAYVDAPYIDLDSSYYKTVTDYDARIESTPSLAGARSLTIRGDWTLPDAVTVVGDAFLPDDGHAHRVPEGAVVGPDGVSA
jgi:UTP--glucose-1-phosphate uridylyltransferase